MPKPGVPRELPGAQPRGGWAYGTLAAARCLLRQREAHGPGEKPLEAGEGPLGRGKSLLRQKKVQGPGRALEPEGTPASRRRGSPLRREEGRHGPSREARACPAGPGPAKSSKDDEQRSCSSGRFGERGRAEEASGNWPEPDSENRVGAKRGSGKRWSDVAAGLAPPSGPRFSTTTCSAAPPAAFGQPPPPHLPLLRLHGQHREEGRLAEQHTENTSIFQQHPSIQQQEQGGTYLPEET